MSLETIKTVASNMRYSFTPPVTESELGSEAYSAGLSIDTCVTDAMRKGWLKAWRESCRS